MGNEYKPYEGRRKIHHGKNRSESNLILRSNHFNIPNPDSSSNAGIPGDGRCMFRSVVHGALLRSGRQVPRENVTEELADDLRTKVVNELIKRRAETEWFLEGDFETYVSHMKRSHVWGGEPELLMSSHVLKVPITVYMRDKKSSSIKIVAEYGQQYGKENPVSVLYHDYGHYDLLKTEIYN